jgi:ketosteroid isomerase-like protein
MAIAEQEAFETVTDTFSADNLDQFAALLADDVVFQAPGGTGGKGKGACIESYRRWFDDFPDARVQVQGLHVFDHVTVDETLTGTRSGIARTGRSAGLGYFLLLRFCDGKHVSLNLILDRLLKREQLGLIKGPGYVR